MNERALIAATVQSGLEKRTYSDGEFTSCLQVADRLLALAGAQPIEPTNQNAMMHCGKISALLGIDWKGSSDELPSLVQALMEAYIKLKTPPHVAVASETDTAFKTQVKDSLREGGIVVIREDEAKRLCSDALAAIAGIGAATPQEGYGSDVAWALRDCAAVLRIVKTVNIQRARSNQESEDHKVSLINRINEANNKVLALEKKVAEMRDDFEAVGKALRLKVTDSLRHLYSEADRNAGEELDTLPKAVARLVQEHERLRQDAERLHGVCCEALEPCYVAYMQKAREQNPTLDKAVMTLVQKLKEAWKNCSDALKFRDQAMPQPGSWRVPKIGDRVRVLKLPMPTDIVAVGLTYRVNCLTNGTNGDFAIVLQGTDNRLYCLPLKDTEPA